MDKVICSITKSIYGNLAAWILVASKLRWFLRFLFVCLFIWMADPNPHMGHLAWGDAFVVTADSISMLSEACSTGYLCRHPLLFILSLFYFSYSSSLHIEYLSCRKPVYVIGTEHCKWKFTEFHKNLRERGVVRPFTGLEDVWPSISFYVPLIFNLTILSLLSLFHVCWF